MDEERANGAEVAPGAKSRALRAVLLDTATAEALTYLRERLSPAGTAEPLDAAVVARLLIREAADPQPGDVPLDFPAEVYRRPGNVEQNFLITRDLLERWKQLTAAYQEIVDQQVEQKLRPRRTRPYRVTAADVLRLLIQRKAAQVQGPAPAKRGRPRKQG